jgi:urease accessory protein
MILVESTLGNLRDPRWQDQAEGCVVDLLVLEQWEAPKNRLRKASEGGVELAIALPRSQHLHDGDVLHHDKAKGVIIAARVPLKDVLVIELEELGTLPPDELLRACFELGHALGNQHWPAVIKGSTVYVPLSVDRKVMSSVMRTHAFPHIQTRFVPGEDVAAKLDARDVRLLFAGADATPHHHHGDVGDHAHGGGHHHDHAHEHEADEAAGHAHPHEHHPDDPHEVAAPHTHTHTYSHAHGHSHTHPAEKE